MILSCLPRTSCRINHKRMPPKYPVHGIESQKGHKATEAEEKGNICEGLRPQPRNLRFLLFSFVGLVTDAHSPFFPGCSRDILQKASNRRENFRILRMHILFWLSHQNKAMTLGRNCKQDFETPLDTLWSPQEEATAPFQCRAKLELSHI